MLLGQTVYSDAGNVKIALQPMVNNAGVNDETTRQVAPLVPTEVPVIPFDEVKAISNNFGESSLIGQGLFARGYACVLSSGQHVVIKLLNKSQQSNE